MTKDATIQIVWALNAVAAELSGRDAVFGEWTPAIKKGLIELGHNLGHKVATSGCPGVADWGEWLFDLCWLAYEKLEPLDDRRLKAIPLAVECEWAGPEDVVDDFEKLLVCHADLRLMIFDDTAERGGLNLLGLLEAMARDSVLARTGGVVLLAKYKNADKRFEYRTVEVKRYA